MSGQRKNGGRKTKDWLRRLHYSDNLSVLREMDDASVDLIYLDPPFNSNRDYASPIGSKAAGAAFKDTWDLTDVDEAWHNEIYTNSTRALKQMRKLGAKGTTGN